MTLPRNIQNGDDLDADVVMENLNDLDGRFPVTKANIGSVYSSVIDWDSPVPASALGGATIGGGSSGASAGVASGLQSDPLFVRAYGVPYIKRRPNVYWSQTGPEVAARVGFVNGGFLTFDENDDVVWEHPRNSAGGTDDVYAVRKQHPFSAGDGPHHGVQVSATEVYVACNGSSFRGIKKFTIGAEDAATSVIDLTASFDNLGKVTVDRHGRYLYVAGKPTGGGNLSSLVRVDIAASTPTASSVAMATTTTDIVDLVINYGPNTGVNSTGTVMVLQNEIGGGSGGRLSRVPESQTSEYGGALGAVTTVKTYPNGEKAMGMCNWRGRCAVITYDATNIKMYIESYEHHVNAGALTSFSTTAAAGDDPLLGCVATDGDLIATLLDSGKVALFRFGNSGFTLYTPEFSITGSGGDYANTSGLCYNGKSWFGAANPVAAGDAVLFIF